MAEYLNQHDVMALFGLKDYRVLKRWCKEVRPEIVPRPRKGYGPAVWYTGTQVKKLERVAEAHGRAVQRPGAGGEMNTEESAPTALLAGEESISAALLSSLQSRLEVLEGLVNALGLPEGETLSSLIQKEVARQLRTRARVSKVDMRPSDQ